MIVKSPLQYGDTFSHQCFRVGYKIAWGIATICTPLKNKEGTQVIGITCCLYGKDNWGHPCFNAENN